MRLAIGAGGGRLIRQLLTESSLLSLIGGAGGVAIAYIGTDLLSQVTFPIDATLTVDLRPDPLVLWICLVLTLATGILFGLGPAVGSARTDLSTTLKEGARGLRLAGKRNHFVVAQLALSTALLLTAGLFVRSFETMSGVPLGFDPRNVTVATIALGSNEYGPEEQATILRPPSRPGAGLPERRVREPCPFRHARWRKRSQSAWAPDGDPEGSMSVGINVVDPSYFKTMRVQLVEGRFFDDRDVRWAPPPWFSSTRLWRSGSGRDAPRWGVRCARATARRGGHSGRSVPLDLRRPAPLCLLSVWGGAPRPPCPSMSAPARRGARRAEIRRLVRELDPDVAPSGLRTMDEVVRSNMFGPRFLTALASLFSGIGLLWLPWASMASSRSRLPNSRRSWGSGWPWVPTLEITPGRDAPRCSLRCDRLRDGRPPRPRHEPVGRSLLYNVRPLDPLTYALVPTVLMGTALVASVIPARRATQVDPTMLMRDG